MPKRTLKETTKTIERVFIVKLVRAEGSATEDADELVEAWLADAADADEWWDGETRYEVELEQLMPGEYDLT